MQLFSWGLVFSDSTQSALNLPEQPHAEHFPLLAEHFRPAFTRMNKLDSKRCA